MNTAIATRLLWKEYRQQRNLWIALLFGATLLQVIFRSFVDGPRTSSEGLALLSLHVGTAAMMTSLFAVCSSAISFAIEREEGTHLRLVSLSCPPGMALSIKFLVGVLGTILLFAVSAAIGISLSTGFEVLSSKLSLTSTEERISTVYWSAVVICGGLTCGAFFSMLFRKVLPAVIAACVVSFMVLPTLYGAWANSTPMWRGSALRLDRPETIWFMLILVAAIGVFGAIDYFLVRWWMNRGFSESPRVRSRSLFRRLRVQRDGLDGSVTVEIGGADRAEFEVLTADQARILPPPRLGLSILYNNWGRGRARVLKFLCWKEMAESRRLFFMMWGIGVLLAIACGFEAQSLAYSQYGSPDWFPLTFGLTIVSMFVCGLMTFRGEQSQDSYRLLSDHGVTPGYVWISKQVVWLTRMFAIPVTMLVIYAVLVRFDRRFAESRAVFHHPREWNSLPSLWWLTDCLKVVATLLTFYSVVQLASLAWRRAALSIFFALLCCVLLGMWLGATTYFEVPVFVGILPLAPALLLVTRLRTRGWLIGDDRFKRWLLPGTVGVLGIAVCWLTTATWRIYEIPTAQPIVATKTLDDGSTAETINGLTDAERAAILSPVSDEEAKAAAFLDGPTAAEQLREVVAFDACAFESPASDTLVKRSAMRSQADAWGRYPLKLAKQETAAGNAAKALSRIGDAFKVARLAAGRGANRDFDHWRTITLDAMQALAEWSTSGGVTDELVAKATELVTVHMERSPDPFAVSFAHHQIVRNTLDLAYDNMATMRGQGGRTGTDLFEQYMMLKFPGTKWRIDRLVDWYEVRSAQLIAEADRINASETSAGMSLGSWYREQVAIARSSDQVPTLPEHREWLRTTPIPGGLLGDIGLGLVYVNADAETKSRGTQIAMLLHQTRRESGELPKSLDDLKLADDVLIDPWSGRQFVWYPEGISNEINTTDPPIPANTPFLFSGGPAGGQLGMLPETIRVEGPFDPPATVIPVDGEKDGDRAASEDSEDGSEESESPAGNASAAQVADGLGFGASDEELSLAGGSAGPFGGMGATEPEVRWETVSKWAIVGQSGDMTTVMIKPVVWLFPEVDTTPAE